MYKASLRHNVFQGLWSPRHPDGCRLRHGSAGGGCSRPTLFPNCTRSRRTHRAIRSSGECLESARARLRKGRVGASGGCGANFPPAYRLDTVRSVTGPHLGRISAGAAILRDVLRIKPLASEGFWTASPSSCANRPIYHSRAGNRFRREN